jgi:hypothetical protein
MDFASLTLSTYLIAMFLLVMILPIVAASIAIRVGVRSAKKTYRVIKK